MTEDKQKTLDNKIIEPKEPEPKKVQCPYCRKKYKIITKRHLDVCKPYQEYLEKAKKDQKSIFEFCENIERKSYPIDLIFPNSWNVNSMSLEDFEGLKESIWKTKGEYLKKNPIQIRELEKDKYEIIDGEHRWRACKELDFAKIPAIIEKEVDIEKSKVLNVIYSKNRGKIDYFKLSKLLNEEYKDENGKKKCTQQKLADRFGFESKSTISEILKIFPSLKNQKFACANFDHSQLIRLSRCKNDILREKLIEHSLKNNLPANDIGKIATKFNKIAKFLNNELDNETRKCILNILVGNSIFELSFDELIEKIFKMTIENHDLKLINRYNLIWEKHNRTAIKIMETYDKEHGMSYSKGRYLKGYCDHPAFKLWVKDVFNFFEKYYNKDIRCFKDGIKLKLGKNFIPHHKEYIWDFICYVFYDVEQIIFPCCNKCHQKGTSKNWR